jgi:hypothetical protein
MTAAVACPYCGGAVEAREGESVVTCPYCGTAFTLSGGEVGEHLMGSVNYTPQQVFEIFKLWAVRAPEAPNDLPEKAELGEWRLDFHPYYVYEVVGVFAGERAAAVVAVPANRALRGTALERLKMGLAGKVHFSWRLAERAGGRVVPVDVAPEEADRAALPLAARQVAARLAKRLGRAAAGGFERLEKMERKLVHAPVYTCLYSYNGRAYRFLADASDSRILYAEVPVEAKFRAAALAGGGASFALAAASALAGLKLGALAFALFAPLGLAAVGAYCLWRGLAARSTLKRFYG